MWDWWKFCTLKANLVLMVLTLFGSSAIAVEQTANPPHAIVVETTNSSVSNGQSDKTTSSATGPLSSPAELVPMGLTPIQVGPLEITPSKVLLNLSRRVVNNAPLFNATIRFKIRNLSASDVKLILFQQSIEATDNFGTPLFDYHRIRGGGIQLSQQGNGRYQNSFKEENAQFTFLSPRQTLQVQLTPAGELGAHQLKQQEQNFYLSHRSSTMDLSAVIGMITIDNKSELRAFSLSEVPIQINE